MTYGRYLKIVGIDLKRRRFSEGEFSIVISHLVVVVLVSANLLVLDVEPKRLSESLAHEQ
jgi:hypothetical protein